ncbi:hypothetical protein L2E82_10899 [Cichorium intybus]|uniref:Uncharacterized protein n=1 Tax=Cichorium intybus TaxID=13427 RepID=A0ACB9GCF5_CICIN|nr:hypothetical protein L2E82_10899 [Cichorium intybus]
MIYSVTNTQIISLYTLILLCCCCYCFSSKDNITTGETVNDGPNYLESLGKKFRMGFFAHEKTSEVRRYVGIWYTMDPKTVVWVANRDKPVRDSNGIFTVEEGCAKLLDGNQAEYFSTDTEGDSLRALKLLDNGNAVLIDVVSGSILWQSFRTPTDTFLPGMLMGGNLKLTSWKNPEDPGSGSFEFQPDPATNRYVILEESSTYRWKSGNMSMKSYDENQIFPQAFLLLSNTIIETRKILKNLNNGSKTYYYQNYSVIEPYSRLVMNHTGYIQYFSWPQGKSQWVLDWQEPKDNCSVFKVCGSFGICSETKDSLCSCLPGFEATSTDDHRTGAGCKRTSNICVPGTNDTFLTKTMISMDDTTLPFYKSDNESACMMKCLEKCQCLAYSYISQNTGGIVDESRNVAEKGCWFWNSEPDNLRENGAHNISFRVSSSLKAITPSSGEPEPEEKSSSIRRVLAIVIVVSVVVLLSLCGIIYIFYKRLMNRRESNQHNTEFQSNDTQRRIKELLDLDHSNEDEREGIDVPYFELESIIAATDGFSEKNMLGQGGFGPVYKGKLPGGQEIAVKRLSSLSGQGLQEFKNEVMLIAKLQHRNLVRLLGYCIRGEEQILLYEYMPNRSLDTFIFDRTLCTSLDWKMRFDIIMGIARGLNYLHYDSRLRVIHRDLKTSNILLDEDMNPKISDFGLAKIVKGKDLEAITNRVIGTFGYMSPEYALDGLFSVKSDVFSFGVVMLEIVSGRKNTGFYQSQRTLSLLGHAWNLWIENKPLELMDEILTESCNSSEVLKCINIGLLCVQGEPDDRPTMTKVVLMLGGDIVTLPTPKEPAFIARNDNAVSSSSGSSKTDTRSKNMVTITKLDGR